jgi:DTW domain-containing protein YfiP
MIPIPVPVLILQHPQEPSRKDKEAGSAAILQNSLSPCHVATGLSWRSLSHALKGFREIETHAELSKPALWHTLYLGTRTHSTADRELDPGIYYLDKKGNPKDPPENPEIGGLILLDGTWAQAKTLWWRNPWLLKTKRIYIIPKERSLYGNLRKEPRPECVSTLEAAAETLGFLGLDPRIETGLKSRFAEALKPLRGKGNPP